MKKLLIVCMVALLSLALLGCKEYEDAKKELEAGNTKEAIEKFEKIDEQYGDLVSSNEKMQQAYYETAVCLYEKEEYEAAIKAFDAIGDYKDSLAYKELAQQKLDELNNPANPFSGIEVGSTVSFGNYYINSASEKEPLEWLCIGIENDKALLLSKYGLDYQQFNTEDRSIIWEFCTLRNWLNTYFYNVCFSQEEKAYILMTTNTNPTTGTAMGDADTDDIIFLLSILEAEQYFNTSAERMCYPTEYAMQQGVPTEKQNNATKKDYDGTGLDTCWWYLRTSGENLRRVTNIHPNGSIVESGGFVVGGKPKRAVRPAMWITLGEAQEYLPNYIGPDSTPTPKIVNKPTPTPKSDTSGQIYNPPVPNLDFNGPEKTPVPAAEVKSTPTPTPKDYTYTKDLSELKVIESTGRSAVWTRSKTDAYGNSHITQVRFTPDAETTSKPYILFNLDGQYDTFYFTYFQDHQESASVTYTCALTIYADGKKIFSSGDIGNKDKAKSKVLDVSGVSELKIVASTNDKNEYYGYKLYIADAYVEHKAK